MRIQDEHGHFITLERPRSHKLYTSKSKALANKKKARGTKYLKVHPVHYGEKKEE